MDALSAENWVETRLKADETLENQRIYRYVAPPAAKLPYVVFGVQAPKDTNGIGTARVLTRCEVWVRAVGKLGDEAAIAALAAQFDPALVAGEASGVGCVRLNPLSYAELENGQYYRHVGGVYQITSS